MKKIIIGLLTIAGLVGLQTGCSNNNSNMDSSHVAMAFSVDSDGHYTGFTNLPDTEDYTVQDAGEDGFLVMKDLTVAANQDRWDEFVEAAAEGKEADLRIANFFTDEPESPFFSDLYYHGGSYYLFDSSSGQQAAEPFKYLLSLRGQDGNPLRDSGAVVLTNDSALTYQQFRTAIYSSDTKVIQSIFPYELVMFLQGGADEHTSSSALPSPSSSAAPDPLEEPFLYIEQLENLGEGNEQLVQVKSNQDIDKASLEQALNKTLSTSDPEIDFNFTLEWASPRFVQIRLQMSGNQPFTSLFNLDETTTLDGRTYQSEEQPDRNKVLVKYHMDQGSVTLKDIASGTYKLLPAWDTGWIKPIQVSGQEEPSFLFYGEEVHHLMDPSQDKVLNIPSFPVPEDSFGNDYGYHEMYSDRFYPEYTYMVLGNKVLYRINLTDFSRKQLYVFDKPVYGMSSSPDGSKIAVLTAHDDYIGPEADLLVLDHQGKGIFSREKAAYMSHSDGFLFVYPLSWEDNSVLILPADSEKSNPAGRTQINISNGKASVLTKELLTDQQIKDIQAHEGQGHYYPISTIRWSPTGRQAAYSSGAGAIWLYDSARRTVEFVAAGTLLGWMPDGRLAWANTPNQVYTN